MRRQMRQVIKLRIARPTDRLDAIANMYVSGLGLEVLATFEDHDGFDGVVLGQADHPYQFEFTCQRGKPAEGSPSPEHLIVFYLNDLEWRERCVSMTDAGFRLVRSSNPYWDACGTTYEDLDSYRVALVCITGET
jgi:hypothetical protein